MHSRPAQADPQRLIRLIVNMNNGAGGAVTADTIATFVTNPDRQHPALSEAVTHGHLDIVRYLVKQGNIIKVKLCMTALGLLIAFQVSAEIMLVDSLYTGFDAQQRHMNFAQGYGDGQFTRKLLQGNLYFGARFNPNVGFELGYESSQKKSNSPRYIDFGDVAMGQVLGGARLDFVIPRTFVQTSGAHLSLTGFMPIYQDKTELIASAGVMLMKMKLRYQQIADEHATYGQNYIDGTTSNFSTTRLIPRFMLGVQHRLGDSFGIRATLVYERTNKRILAKNIPLFANPLQPGAGARLAATPKNSTILGLGVFYNF